MILPGEQHCFVNRKNFSTIKPIFQSVKSNAKNIIIMIKNIKQKINKKIIK